MIYNTKKDLLKALAQAPKGEQRAKILNINENRNLLQSSGANVTLYAGKPKPAHTLIKTLDEIYLGVIHRLNAKTGYPDGIGALGGLSERTDEEYFHTLTEMQKLNLFGKKDDIIIQNNTPILINDIDLIRINNVLRETKEELGNLGIYDFKINPNDMHLIDMPDVKDDNFAINLWNGKSDVWCITPYCHILKTTEHTLDILEEHSENIHKHEQNPEAAKFSKIKLTQALKSFGNKSGIYKLEDGRNANTDYRYPHEWLVAWALTSDILNNNEEKLINLYKEIQAQTPWKISFKYAAEKMGKDLNFIAKVLKVSSKTIEEMEKFPGGGMFINSNRRSL